jgi:hypothetical protein
MFRRLVAIAAACGAAVGLTVGAMAMPAQAAVTHIPGETGPLGLVRVCVIVSAADAGVCLHV